MASRLSLAHAHDDGQPLSHHSVLLDSRDKRLSARPLVTSGLHRVPESFETVFFISELCAQFSILGDTLSRRVLIWLTDGIRHKIL